HGDDVEWAEGGIHQHRAGGPERAFRAEVVRSVRRWARGFTDHDAHDHPVLLVGSAPHVVDAWRREGVLPRLADWDHRRREGLDAVGYALRLALQRVVRGHRVVR